MEPNLWTFLIICTLTLGGFLYILITTVNKKQMRDLEFETKKLEKMDIKTEVGAAVDKKLKDVFARIEVLESIVTDKTVALDNEISKLK